MATKQVRNDKFSLPSDPEKLVAKLEQFQDVGTRPRQGRDFQAKVNLAFYRGHQFLLLDQTNARNPTLRRVAVDPDDPRQPPLITINKIGGHVERIIAKLTKGNPVPEARPVSDEEDDVSAARVGTRILASECYRIDLETLLPELYGWVVPVGWAYLQCTWNPGAGNKLGTITADDGDKQDRDIYAGNIDVDIVPHSELVLSPGARDTCTARWAIRTIALTPEEVWERYEKEVDAGTTVHTLSDELDALGLLSSGSASSNEGKIAVRQFWLRPGAMRAHPEGLVVTWAGQTILEAPKPFPYKHKELPFIPFNYLSPQGSPWGRTSIDDLIPLQMDYNDSRSREAAIRQVLIPILLAARGSIDADKLEARVQVVDYLPMGAPPRYEMPDARWMTQWETAMNRADAEMGERTGINEASKGQLTGTSPAATVLAQQEAASEPLAVPAKELAKGLKTLGYQILELVRQYWDEKRVVRTWSEAGEPEVERFSAADVNRQLDVHVSSESALPRSKAGRAQLAIELWTQKIVTDPRVLIRMLDLPSTDVMTNQFNLDVRQAERENTLMLHAGMPPVEDWHDHGAHLQTHNNFRKTREYEMLEPKIKGLLEAHCTAHEIVMAQQMSPAASMKDAAGPAAELAAGQIAQGTGMPPADPLAQIAGLQASPPIPSVTEIAAIGQGIPGEQGTVPGIPPDIQADLTGG